MSGHHEHVWKRASGGMVIDTYPERYPYVCECGAFTHDPESGVPCRICAHEDWQVRTDDLVTLSGGPFDGWQVARPVNRHVYYRTKGTMAVGYGQSDDDRDQWRFTGNIWTLPAPIARERAVPGSSPNA